MISIKTDENKKILFQNKKSRKIARNKQKQRKMAEEEDLFVGTE